METRSEVANNLNKNIKVSLKKNNGVMERFSYEKLLKIDNMGKYFKLSISPYYFAIYSFI